MLILLSAADSFFQLIFVLIIFIGVLALTYYVTKWIAGYQKTQGLNKNLEIVEAIRITNNKYVQIVRAGEDKYFVIAIGKEEVTLLGELTASELKFLSEEEKSSVNPPVDFKTILDKLKKKS